MPRLFNGFNFAGYISILARRYHRLCFCAIAITVGCRSLPSLTILAILPLFTLVFTPVLFLFTL